MNSPERAQRIWARVVGFTFLFLIAVFMGADNLLSAIAGSGGHAAAVARIVAAHYLYRSALSAQVIGAIATVVLAMALYATLKPANPDIARLALCWRLGEATLEGVTCALSFVVMRIYATPQDFAAFNPGQLQALVSIIRTFQGSVFYIITAFFGFGSTLFFYLFLKSRYLPRLLSAFGLLASVIVPVMALGNLIAPENAALFQNGWYPIFVAEVITGLWLLLFTVKIPVSRSVPVTPFTPVAGTSRNER